MSTLQEKIMQGGLIKMMPYMNIIKRIDLEHQILSSGKAQKTLFDRHLIVLIHC